MSAITPGLFALFHLVVLLGLMIVAAISGRRARTDAWRNRGVDYRRLTTDEVLKRLGEPKRRRR